MNCRTFFPFEVARWHQFIAGLALVLATVTASGAGERPQTALDQTTTLRFEDAGWSSQFGWGLGCDGIIEQIVESPDGGYYVAGDFSYCGHVQVNNIAHFDPETGIWAALGSDGGSGVDGPVRNIAVFRDKLVVQGIFAAVNVGPNQLATKSFATWDGLSWGPVNDDVFAQIRWGVLAMHASDDLLYVGGYFAFFDRNDEFVEGIAVWDGSELKAFRPNRSGNVASVESITVFRDELYVGGGIDGGGGIRRWDGSAWVMLGTQGGIGLSSSVRDLVVWNDALYATGGFRSANYRSETAEIPASRIARWDGSEWSALGSGLDASGLRLAVAGDRLLVAGLFTTAGGSPAPQLASWDGERWSSVASELVNIYPPARINSILDTPSGILVAGQFSHAAGNPILGQPEEVLHGVGLIDQGRWKGWAADVGDGAYGYVRAFARFQGDLYVGGEFRTIGGQVFNGIARWNGAQWQSVGAEGGNGVSGVVFDLQVTPDGLYVSGNFRTVNHGGQELIAGSVARWDGERWHSLGTGDEAGVFGTVETMAWTAPHLYVGGSFYPPPHGESGFPAYNVARWNGSQWSALGDESGNGVNGRVRAMAMVGDDAYVGGTISSAGINPTGSPAQSTLGIARWDGSEWHSVGATGIGLDFNSFPDWGVFAMAAKGNDLYVGGAFFQAEARGSPPIPVRSLVRWDGTQWHNIGGGPDVGVNGSVRALAFIGETLVVGGRFDSIETPLDVDMPAPNIAILKNNQWVTSGSGLTRPGRYALVSTLFPEADGGLFVGGYFDQAGQKASSGLAYHRPDAANYSYIYWNPAEPGWGYNLQHQGELLFGTWYTYADDGQPMFLTVEATLQPDGSFAGPIYRFAGTPFGQINGSQAFTAISEIGQATMRFDADGELNLAYTVDGVSQVKQLERFVFAATPPSCFGTTESRREASNYSDLWWNDSESGWGLTLSHQGDTILALWYTYGEGGRDQWISASALVLQPDGGYTSTLQRPQSGTPLAQIMGSAATDFPVPEVGSAQLRFNDGENGFFGYTVGDVTQTKAIKRFVVVGPNQPKPLCVH